jgi:hypothetical protein
MRQTRRVLTTCLGGVFFLLLTACHDRASSLVDGSTSGWPADAYFDTAAGVVPAHDSYGWRLDTTMDGPQTYIWISGEPAPIDRARLTKENPIELVANNYAGLIELGMPGILLHFSDDGRVKTGAVLFCLKPNDTLQCVSSENEKVVVSDLDDAHATGAVFSTSKDRRRRFVALFDVAISNVDVPFESTPIQRTKDAEDASGAFLDFLTSANSKDAAGMRSLSVPERSRDWDHFGVLTSMQRVSQQKPRLIAGAATSEAANLWFLPTLPIEYPSAPFEVHMTKNGHGWLMNTIEF